MKDHSIQTFTPPSETADSSRFQLTYIPTFVNSTKRSHRNVTKWKSAKYIRRKSIYLNRSAKKQFTVIRVHRRRCWTFLSNNFSRRNKFSNHDARRWCSKRFTVASLELKMPIGRVPSPWRRA